MKVTIEYEDLQGRDQVETRTCKTPETRSRFLKEITSRGGIIKQVFG